MRSSSSICWACAACSGGSSLAEALSSENTSAMSTETGSLDAPHRMLMNYVARNGKKIGLGTADALVSLDSQQAQEDFLGQIRDVIGVAQANGQKPAQPRSVPSGNGCDKVSIAGHAHTLPSPGRVSPRTLERYSIENGYASGMSLIVITMCTPADRGIVGCKGVQFRIQVAMAKSPMQ